MMVIYYKTHVIQTHGYKVGPRKGNIEMDLSDCITLFQNGNKLKDTYNTYTCMSISCVMGSREMSIEMGLANCITLLHNGNILQDTCNTYT